MISKSTNRLPASTGSMKVLKTLLGAYRCPQCGIKHYNRKYIGTLYCKHCHQKLDWTDVFRS